MGYEAMIPDTSCCHIVHRSKDVQPTLRQMVVWDWYDGPVTGLLVCEMCHAEFYFFMVDWSDDHAIRIFALQRLESGAIATLVGLVDEEPQWPIWMPQKLKFPTESDRSWIDQLDLLVLRNRQASSEVLAWDNAKHEPIVMAEIGEDKLWFMEQLLESESMTSPFDWFGYLRLKR
jgi:hypothetical protein